MKKKSRNWLIGGAAGLALLAGAFLYKPSSSPEKPQPTVSASVFPDSLAGAREIKRYDVPDAKHTLVHIRQRHLINGGIDEVRKKDEGLSAVQSDIYHIVDDLVQKTDIRSIYLEGLVEEFLPNMEEGARKAHQIEKTLNSLETMIGSDSRHAIPQSVLDETKELRTIYDSLMTKNAGSRLFYEGKIGLYAGESSDIAETLADPEIDRITDLSAAIALGVIDRPQGLDQETIDEANYALTDMRENYLLERIVKRGEPYGVVIYGARHAWGGAESCGPAYSLDGRLSLEDNIATWNKNHPNQKFSLIEITPQNYVNGE